jgi:hypothetical protein
MSFWKRKSQPVAPITVAPVDVNQALDEAKTKLSGIASDDFLRARSLEFAQSLLSAVGEDPATPQNQLLIHQMAIENLRARQALIDPPRR